MQQCLSACMCKYASQVLRYIQSIVETNIVKSVVYNELTLYSLESLFIFLLRRK